MLALCIFSHILKPASGPGREWPWLNAHLQLQGSSPVPQGSSLCQLLPLGSIFTHRMRGSRIHVLGNRALGVHFHFPPSEVAGNSSFSRTFTSHRTIYPVAFLLCALHQTNHVVWNFPELRKDGKCGSGWSGGSAAQVGVSGPGWVWTGQRAASQSCDSCARPMVSEERHEYLFTSAG